MKETLSKTLHESGLKVIVDLCWRLQMGLTQYPCACVIHQGTYFISIRDDFKTQPQVDWRYRLASAGFYCSKQ